MDYGIHTFDRIEGAFKTTQEAWHTVTEIGAMYGKGPQQIREILHHMGMLQEEIVQTHRKGKRRTDSSYRLTDRAIEQGLGKRVANPRSGRPFDIISEEGLRLIAQAWDETIKDLEAEKHPTALAAWEALQGYLQATSKTLNTRGQLHWMLDHLEELARRGVILNQDTPSHEVLASTLAVSQPLVSEYAKDRDKGRLKAERQKVRKLGEAPRTQAHVSKAADRSEVEATLAHWSSGTMGCLRNPSLITDAHNPSETEAKLRSEDFPATTYSALIHPLMIDKGEPFDRPVLCPWVSIKEAAADARRFRQEFPEMAPDRAAPRKAWEALLSGRTPGIERLREANPIH